MSTNYQALWKIGENVWTQLNIGSTGSSATLSGQVFTSWKAWKEFLVHNEQNLTIRDEYATPMTVIELIQRFEETTPESRRKHFDFLAAGDFPEYQDCVSYEHTRHNACWLDADGFTMWNTDFS